jgi:hypothetical protein
MSIRKLLETLVNKSTSGHRCRPSALRARPQLEALETRMAPSDVTGGLLLSPTTSSATTSPQTGS